MAERLQKLISAAGLASRRAAEAMIAAGRVTVNGIPAVTGQSADPEADVILVDGQRLQSASEEKTYIMLNKPRGYVTTLRDEKGRPTVAELVKDVGKRVYPVGRLDMDSDGLLLLTDDGEFANAMMHPGFEVRKTYRTAVIGDVEAALPILRSAMVIDGYRIRPAEVHIASENELDIVIHEGRNRQVRKMCAAAGLTVVRLTRIAEGGAELGSLPLGQWRYLTENEIYLIKNQHEFGNKFK